MVRINKKMNKMIIIWMIEHHNMKQEIEINLNLKAINQMTPLQFTLKNLFRN